MPKRTRWLITGVALGAGGSLWAQRKAKTAAAHYGPAGLVEATGRRLVAALADGREAMREREAQLKGTSPDDDRRAGLRSTPGGHSGPAGAQPSREGVAGPLSSFRRRNL
ncbi:MAG: hypothetical protein ACP5P1_10110 [Acidimicrobiales bacterium]